MLEYINLLTGDVLIKVMSLAVLTCLIIGVIDSIIYTEKMGEDKE